MGHVTADRPMWRRDNFKNCLLAVWFRNPHGEGFVLDQVLSCQRENKLILNAT